MTLLFFDGFDHYSDAQRTTSGMWTNFTAALAGSVSVSAGVGRSAAGIRSNSGQNNSQGFARKSLVAGNASGAIGFWFRASIIGNYTPLIAAIEDSNTQQISLCLNASGTLSVRRGNGAGTVLGTTTYAYPVGSGHFFELAYTIDPSVGVATVYVDGVQVLNLTGQNTRNTANSSWNGVLLGIVQPTVGSNQSTNYDYDDFYVCDGVNATATQGAPFNTALGDRNVRVIYPTGTGNYSQYTGAPSSSIANFNNVDENPPTDDTDYNRSGTIGNRDSYTYAIPVGTISALWPLPYSRKDDAGTRKVTTFSRISGVDYDNADATLSQSYQFVGGILGLNPASSSTWASGTLEFGIKTTA